MELENATEAWVICVRRKAHLNQCQALAEATGLKVSKTIEIPGTTATDYKLVKLASVAKAIALCLRAFAMNPFPQNKVILCSGRSISLLVWMWKLWAGKKLLSIYVGHAKSPLVFYDLMLIPEHDVPIMQRRRIPPVSVEIITTTGILTRQSRDVGQKNQATVLACLGGDNITFSYDGPAFQAFLTTLENVSQTHELKIAVSGRTTLRIRQMLDTRTRLKSLIIEAHDREAFVETRNRASSIFVCPDSITMISEALASGAVVFVPKFEALNSHTSDFHFVTDCIHKGYVLNAEAFPASAPGARFPDSLAQARPHVLAAINRWRSANI